MNKKFISLSENTNLSGRQSEIASEIWSPVMRSSVTAGKCWPKLEKYFPEYQVFLLSDNDEVVGFANTIPFFWDRELAELPNEGWDWLIRKGITDFENKVAPNCLGGLQIGVSKKYQQMGFSKQIVEHAKKISTDNGFRYFIIPIRPVLKYRYPLIDMGEYINWEKEGKIFDPWIRVHIECGAEIIKICSKSMTITGSIKKWESISGLPIVGSGRYIIDGAASPVDMDMENDTGTYYDENVWINYKS